MKRREWKRREGKGRECRRRDAGWLDGKRRSTAIIVREMRMRREAGICESCQLMDLRMAFPTDANYESRLRHPPRESFRVRVNTADRFDQQNLDHSFNSVDQTLE